MRHFPLPLALALATALLLNAPFAGADDCTDGDGEDHVCRSFRVDDPGLPPQTRPLVSPYDGTYYLYVELEECTSGPSAPISNACRGTEFASGSGVPTPVDTPVALGAGVMGLLYQESNGVTGFQRTPFGFGTGEREADRAVLL